MQTSIAPWEIIDLDWINRTYPEVRDALALATDSNSREVIGLLGQCGCSPNCFFDETYYLDRYPDVCASIEAGRHLSGFDHYQDVGYKDRSPHWLFNEGHYTSRNRDVRNFLLNNRGFKNGYDHYLRYGDREYRTGSWFFVPHDYIASASGFAAAEPFHHYVSSRAVFAASPWFDAEWYASTYGLSAASREGGECASPLHHYLTKCRSGLYDPLPEFSERYYRDHYPDIRHAIESGQFHSGYEHFLMHGITERRRPHPDVDLETLFQLPNIQRLLTNGRVPDVFVAVRQKVSSAPDLVQTLKEQEHSTKLAFEQKAASVAMSVGRRPLDFSYKAPDITVIVVMFNNLDMTLLALTALRSSFFGEIQLIVVDSGSKESPIYLQDVLVGAVVLRTEGNVGFIRACNMALEAITASIVLFLNNDTEIQFGSISSALARFANVPGIGALGGKIIRSNGLLQEAGAMIFRDGSVAGYLRGHLPDSPEASFARRVDFCSGACLFTRAELLFQLGGFNEAYIPAYYEETDFCLSVWKKGYEVWYDPLVSAIHYEYGSSSIESGARFINRNRLVLCSRHADYLSARPIRSPFNMNVGRSRNKSGCLSILVIDDRVPLARYGSGFARSNDIIRVLAEQGHDVTVYPIYRQQTPGVELVRAFPDTVEIIWDRDWNSLEEFLANRVGIYDAMWICRTHNLRRLMPIIERTSHLMGRLALIADTEAVSAPREKQRDDIMGVPQASQTEMTDRLRYEFEPLTIATKVVAVNQMDANFLRESGLTNVSILGHLQKARPTSKAWEERTGLLFVGAVHELDSPNYDSICWMVNVLWPRLQRNLPEGTELIIAGHIGPNVSLLSFRDSDGVRFLGEVDDLRVLYDQARFFLAPTRFAAGVPYKVHEAAAHGLPVIASDILCDQVGWMAGDEILCAKAGDAEDFTNVICAAYEDRAAWKHSRNRALARILSENNAHTYSEAVRRIIGENDT